MIRLTAWGNEIAGIADQLWNAFLDGSLTDGKFPVTLWVLMLWAVAITITGRRLASAWRALVLWTLVGGLFGTVATWLVGNVMMVFGVPLADAVIARVGAGLALFSLGVGALVERGSSAWRRALAVVLVILAPLSTAMSVNAVYNQYTSVRALLNLPLYDQLDLDGLQQADQGRALWSVDDPPADLPFTGTVSLATIPATVSGFPARQAAVYLPPAARVADPPALPVLIMLSGQPGTPSDVFTAGKLASILDDFSSKHGGIAPIVVAADQLGSPWANPMCVDSPMGNSATYLTVDVPTWISQHLPVSKNIQDWTIGGFSQGGTCASQLGPSHQEVFGAFVDISGEIAPRNGDDQQTADRGFGGSLDAWHAGSPEQVIRGNAPSSQRALFAAGSTDGDSVSTARTLAQAAKQTGRSVQLLISQGTWHDWFTVQNVMQVWLAAEGQRMGLGIDDAEVAATQAGTVMREEP